jgi:hypothetical protein
VAGALDQQQLDSDAMRDAVFFSVEDRRREKEEARQQDVARLLDGEADASELSKQNGFCSALDWSKAEVARFWVPVDAG